MPSRAIREFMTASPHTIGHDQTLAAAHHKMREHGIRHLPVLDGGELIGIVSVNDLHLVETLKGVDPDTVVVAEAMTPEPYIVRPETPLESVAATMAEQKYGSAVVVEDDRVVGVFTTVDALRALVALLAKRRKRARKAPDARRAGASAPAGEKH